MGWLGVAVGVAASLHFYGQEQFLLPTAAAISTIGTFWTYGVMHNYAMASASKRRGFRDGFGTITERNAHSVPNALALANMIFSLASIGLLIAAVVIAL